MLNIPERIIYWQRIGLMLIKAYSTFRIKHYEDIHLRGLEIDLSPTLHSLGLWKTKSKSTPRRLLSIHRMSQCSQVIQGLIKALMTHTARCNIPSSLNWLDTPKVGQLLAHSPQQESIGDGDELPSRNDFYLRWTVCCKSCSMSTERKAWVPGV